MNRFIARRFATEWYINIPATHMKQQESFVYAYNGDRIVAIVDLGCVDAVWMSNTEGSKE